MQSLRYILLSLTALLTVSVSNGKSLRAKSKVHLQDMHIGYYQGMTWLDVSKGINTPHKKTIASTSGISFGFPFINQFRSEVGLSINNLIPGNNKAHGLMMKNNSFVSVPVTIQYYILPKKSKIQPYFGFGAMIVPDANKIMLTKDGDGLNTLQQGGLGTINMLITQGINIEINTHIHLTESLHIINSEGKTSYGLNLGVNLYVP